MADSMRRYFYCEGCGVTLLCVYEPWRGAWVFYCATCPGRPERLSVTPTQRERYAGEEREVLEKLIARDAEEPPILGTFTASQPSASLLRRLGAGPETTQGTLPAVRPARWDRWSGDGWDGDGDGWGE